MLSRIHPRHPTLIRLFYASAENVKWQTRFIFLLFFYSGTLSCCIETLRRVSSHQLERDVESGREPWDAIIPLSPFFDYRVRFSSGGGSGGGFLSCFETMLYNLTRVFLWWLSLLVLPISLLLLLLSFFDGEWYPPLSSSCFAWHVEVRLAGSSRRAQTCTYIQDDGRKKKKLLVLSMWNPNPDFVEECDIDFKKYHIIAYKIY
jgi:hypothetical protein